MTLVFPSLSLPQLKPDLSPEREENESSDEEFLEDFLSDDSDDDGENIFSAFCNIENVSVLQEETKWVYPKEDILARQLESIHHLFFSTGDWIFNLSFAYPITNEILFQSIALFRKYLASSPVSQPELQLYAATCVWIYVKMDHNVIDSLPLLIRCCHDKFTKADFIKAESQILSSVDYNFHPSTPFSTLYTHIHLFNSLYKNEALFALSLFLSQCSLLFLDFCPIRPSLISLCAVCLSGILTNSSESPEFSAEFSKYSSEEILKCSKLIIKAFSHILSKTNSGIYRKMKSAKSTNVESYFQDFNSTILFDQFSHKISNL